MFLLQNTDQNITCISDEDCVGNYNLQEEQFQCAQDPLEGFTQEFLRIQKKSMEKKKQRRSAKKSSRSRSFCCCRGSEKRNHMPQSFVVNAAPCKGIRLIQIQVLQLDNTQRPTSQVREDSDDVLLSAQYVVKDICDNVMDETERIINNISKKICGYSYSSY